MSEERAPLRADEVASLEDTIKRFKEKGTTATVKVRDVGPVAWIAEAPLADGGKVIVLGSPELFHFIRETPEGLGTEVHVAAHPMIEQTEPFSNPPIKIDHSRRTLDREATFHATEVYREKDLVVLQVVKSTGENRELYWLGISGEGAGAAYDTVQLVGGGNYSGCARYTEPENVAAVERIAKPFVAQVRVQPATQGSGTEETVVWNSAEGAEEGQEVSECMRPGEILWKEGKFRASMEREKCAAPEQPKFIRVGDDGIIRVSDTPVN